MRHLFTALVCAAAITGCDEPTATEAPAAPAAPAAAPAPPAAPAAPAPHPAIGDWKCNDIGADGVKVTDIKLSLQGSDAFTGSSKIALTQDGMTMTWGVDNKGSFSFEDGKLCMTNTSVDVTAKDDNAKKADEALLKNGEVTMGEMIKTDIPLNAKECFATSAATATTLVYTDPEGATITCSR